MSGAPGWVDALRRRLDERFAARPWQVPLLLRLSDADRSWCRSLPDSGGDAADRRPLRIASVTKVYLAAALFRLAEQGRIDLDAPLPRVAGPDTIALLRDAGYAVDAITVAHLMHHSAGLRDHCFSDMFLDRLKADPGHRWTRAEQIAIAMRLGAPLASPGVAFAYSDTGYVILGDVIERAAAATLADAVPDLLSFGPLGLDDTVWDEADRDPASIERQCLGEHDATRWDASFDLFGGGGLVATLADMDRFLRALFDGQVFEDAATLRAIRADRSLPSDPGFVHNGLMFRGDVAGEDVWAHTGFWGLQAAILPARGLALTAAFNRAPEDGLYGKDDLLIDFAEAVAGR